jgi:hypothetical protein
MAYLARIEPLESQLVGLPAGMQRIAPKPEFSALEWSIIRLSRGDGLSSIRAPGPLLRFTRWLLGRSVNPRLASERLEALRRISVLSWHFGFSVPGEDVADFLSAGFTPDQYELLVSTIRAPQLRTIEGEVLA